MLRRALACVQSCQSLHCSRTCTKWAYIWQFFSVSAQTRPSMHAVLPEPSLLSYIHKMGVFLAYFISQCSDKPVSPDPSLQSHMHRKGVHTVYFISQCSDAHEHLCSFARAFTAFAHAQNGCTYGIFLVNAQTRLSMRTVSSEPLLLAH